MPDAVSTTTSPREAKSDTPEEPPPEEVTRKSAEGGPVLASPGALAYPQQASGAVWPVKRAEVGIGEYCERIRGAPQPPLPAATPPAALPLRDCGRG